MKTSDEVVINIKDGDNREDDDKKYKKSDKKSCVKNEIKAGSILDVKNYQGKLDRKKKELYCSIHIYNIRK